ncbi:UNVERIFIED_CONTAM: hypothetical protein GTU68_029542 [Idotea baltica]|nr:hypothetical protein [Idotea baltica]
MDAHILYVEDDADLAFITKDQLELEGYQVTHCPDGAQAFKQIKEHKYDVCILDVMLPEIDGFTLAKKIRTQNIHVPIIFLTAKSLEEDRLKGFEIGGDDYITKPYSLVELMYKVKVFLKRNVIQNSEPRQAVQIGRYTFDTGNLSLIFDDQVKALTEREAEVLKHLSDHINSLVKREDLLSLIWGKNDYFLGRSLDVFISRLRKYLKEDPRVKIENVHGVGFRLLTE